MRQFDVYENPSRASRSFAPFIVVLQSHHLEFLDTVVVAPLVRDMPETLSLIDIPLTFNGETLFISISELGPMDRSSLRRRKGDLLEMEDVIRRALERLFSGF